MAFIGSHLSASNGQIMILSGATTTAQSPDESAYVDTNLFVSGSSNSRGTSVRGTALFGGDLHISGSLTVDGTAPGGGGGGVDRGWFGPSDKLIVTTGSVYFSTENSGGANPSITFNEDVGGSYTGAVFNEQGAGADFRVESSALPGMIITDGGTNQLILHSSGTSASNAGGNIDNAVPVPTDVATYISGAIGSQGVSNSKGTTLITGDLVVSGGIENGVVFNERGSSAASFRVELDGVPNAFRITGDSVHINPDGSNVGFTVGGYGTGQPCLSIDENGLYINDSHLDQNFRVETDEIEGIIMADGGTNQLLLHINANSAEHAGGTDIPAGSDVGTYISGTIGSMGVVDSKGVTLVTGDVVLSGSLYGGFDPEEEVSTLVIGSTIILGGEEVVFAYGGDTDDGEAPGGEDAIFMVSGSIGGKDNEENTGVALFGGDLVVSGNTYLAMKQTGPSGPAGSDLANVGTDVTFFVSGAGGSAGSAGSGKGTALFGGDLFCSGNMYIRSVDTSADAGPTLFISRDSSSPAEQDEIGKISFGGKSTTGLGVSYGSIVGKIGKPGPLQGKIDIFIRKAGPSRNALSVGFEEVVINEDSVDIDFRVESNNKTHAFVVDAGTDQVLILSGGGGTGKSPDERNATDMNFFVSGSADSKDSGNKGTALFGGDLHVSGNLTVDGSSPPGGSGISWDGSATNGVATFKDANEATVEANLTFDGTNLLIADQGQIQFSNGNQTISNAGADLSIASTQGLAIAADGGVLNLQGSNQIKLTTSGGPVLILTGVNGGGKSPNESNASDMNFFVSGTIGSKDTGNSGTALFGGDLHISGNLSVDNSAGLRSGALIGLQTDYAWQSDRDLLQVSNAGGDGDTNKGGVIHLIRNDTTIADDQFLGAVKFLGTDGTSSTGERGGASIIGRSVGTHANNDFGGKLEFLTTPDGEVTPQIRVLIEAEDSGNIEIGYQTDHSSRTTFVANTTLGYDGSAIFNEEGADADFRVETVSQTHGIFVDSDQDRIYFFSSSNGSDSAALDIRERAVLILSGGSGTSPDERTYTDTNFFVSGTIGSKDTGNSGTSLFGGDLVVSGGLDVVGGTVFSIDGVGASNVTTDSGNLTLSTTTSGNVVVQAVAGAVDIDADSGTLSLDGSAGINIGTGGSVAVDLNADTLDIDALGTITIDSLSTIGIGTADNDFNISIGTSGERIIALGSAGLTGITIDAGSNGIDIDCAGGAGQDIEITNTGGSVHIAATEDAIDAIKLTSNNIVFIGGDPDNNYAFYSKPIYLEIIEGPASRTGKLWNGSGNILNWGGLGFQTSGSAHFNITTADFDFQVESGNKTHAIFVDGGTDSVLILSGGGGTSPHESAYTDVNFFVSGTVDSKGTGNRGTALFGGDLVISGNLYGPRDRPNKPATQLTVKSPLTVNARLFNFEGDEGAGPDGRDGTFLVSGTIGGVQRGEGVTIIGGDTVISGTMYGGLYDFGDGEFNEILKVGSTLQLLGSNFYFDGDSQSEEDTSPDGADIVFSVSGSIGQRGEDSFEGSGGTAAFGGDVMISGSLLVNRTIMLNMSSSSEVDFDVSLASLVPVYKVDTTQTIVTASLPAAANTNLRGLTVIFKDVGGNAGTNAIVIEPAAGDEIDHAGALKIEANYGAVGLMLDFSDDLSTAHWWTIFNRS